MRTVGSGGKTQEAKNAHGLLRDVSRVEGDVTFNSRLETPGQQGI